MGLVYVAMCPQIQAWKLVSIDMNMPSGMELVYTCEP